MNGFRLLLYPFSILYGAITTIRNSFYDNKIFKSTRFTQVKTICIGNLSTGGTGKTPHVEYLVRLLKQKNIAILSRGYGRKTKGFFEVKPPLSAETFGDEPVQYKNKFPDVTVSVDEKRVHGIEKLIGFKKPDVILLDDAFQHRSLKAGFNILLTEFNKPFFHDHILPAGNLREPEKGAKRADIIIVTKTPADITDEQKRGFKQRLKAYCDKIFFSSLEYDTAIPVFNKKHIPDNKATVLMLTGIANPEPFKKYLQKHYKAVEEIRFGDHHVFSANDIQKLKNKFDNIADSKKLIVTTEKDVMRLQGSSDRWLREAPLFYIPLYVVLSNEDEKALNQEILNYVG